MELFSRDSIARDVEWKVFRGMDVWRLIFKPIDGMRFVTSSHPLESSLFDKLNTNVTEKLQPHGVSLKEMVVVIGDERKKLTYQNADELMVRIIRENLPVIFKVMIKNKIYEFQVN